MARTLTYRVKLIKHIQLNDVLSSTIHQSDLWHSEILALHEKYGPIDFFSARLNFGREYFERWKFIKYKKRDRRGEVALCVRNKQKRILLHTKPFYPMNIYRIPTGGIHEEESVFDAFHRELFEETGFRAIEFQLSALVLYEFHHQDELIPFSSYLFDVKPDGDHPQSNDETENISGFEWIALSRLSLVVEQMESLPAGRWRDWGQMRLVLHKIISGIDE